MIKASAMKPFGLAIKDYHAGDASASVRIVREDGVGDNLAISSFYRSPTQIPSDKVALDNCRGRVLDVGAGVGIHSLYLQEKGLQVCAMDISPEACEVMRQRGLKDVICSSFNDLKISLFDTLLILGRSICMVETLAGLDDFLKRARRLVRPGGQIILNSLDVSKTSDPQNLTYHEANRKDGRYIGEIRLHLEYKKLKGPVTGLLHVDPSTLTQYATKNGWSCEILSREDNGGYLAMLNLMN